MERNFFDKNPVMCDIFNNMSDAVYFIDNRGTILFVNAAGEKLDGYALKDIKGKTVMEAYHLKPSESPLLRVVCSHEPLHEHFFRYYINDREVYQVCNTFPVQLEDGYWGAFSIQKDITGLKRTIDRNIELQKQLFAEDNGKEISDKYYTFDSIIGDHELLRQCKQMAYNAAQSDSSVMLTGMTGSGKELFAQSIHAASKRASRPFLSLNCAAIPETLIEGLLFGTVKGVYTGAIDRKGLFVEADGGTLFLDEINSMPLSSQVKLLRALEERKVQPLGSKEEIPFDIRIISSCNATPQDVFAKKLIREDLFYRLAVVNIQIPSLKDRKSDIFLLAHHFIALYNEIYGKNVLHIEDEITRFFLSYEWPGNVRQLRNCIEGAMNMVGENEISIKRQHLPFYLLQENPAADEDYRIYQEFYSDDSFLEPQSDNEKSSAANKSSKTAKAKKKNGVMAEIRKTERDAIVAALKEAGGNVSKAARILGLSRQTLVYRMKKYEIE